jgi:hypothetical protein
MHAISLDGRLAVLATTEHLLRRIDTRHCVTGYDQSTTGS